MQHYPERLQGVMLLWPWKLNEEHVADLSQLRSVFPKEICRTPTTWFILYFLSVGVLSHNSQECRKSCCNTASSCPLDLCWNHRTEFSQLEGIYMDHQVQWREESIGFGDLEMWHFANDRETVMNSMLGDIKKQVAERRSGRNVPWQFWIWESSRLFVFWFVFFFNLLCFVLLFQSRAVPSTGE